VKKVCYPLPKIIVFHNNKSIVFVEVVVHAEAKVLGGHLGDKVIFNGHLGQFLPDCLGYLL